MPLFHQRRFIGLLYSVCHTDPLSYTPIRSNAAPTRSHPLPPAPLHPIVLSPHRYVLSAEAYESYYTSAVQVRERLTEEFHHIFQGVDVLLTPTTLGATEPLQPPREQVVDPQSSYGEQTANASSLVDHDIVSAYLGDVMTVPVSLAGLPAVTVPFRGAGDGPQGGGGGKGDVSGERGKGGGEGGALLVPPVGMQVVGPPNGALRGGLSEGMLRCAYELEARSVAHRLGPEDITYETRAT